MCDTDLSETKEADGNEDELLVSQFFRSIRMTNLFL